MGFSSHRQQHIRPDCLYLQSWQSRPKFHICRGKIPSSAEDIMIQQWILDNIEEQYHAITYEIEVIHHHCLRAEEAEVTAATAQNTCALDLQR